MTDQRKRFEEAKLIIEKSVYSLGAFTKLGSERVAQRVVEDLKKSGFELINKK
jgi:hypothetical protein